MASPDPTRYFAALARDTTTSPFTALLARTIARLPEVAALLDSAPPTQQNPVLFLAALHDQVLADPTSELAGWYPSATALPRTDDLGPALVAHCRRHEATLRDVVATRRTQTNEVGRCGLFLPALHLVATEVGPLALVDVGTSAGLNLHLDRYRYRYVPGGQVGADSAVELHISVEGDLDVPPEIPEIRARIGIDSAVVDPADEAATRWLRACIWPDQADRVRRFDGALAIAREHPADLRSGDAVETVGPAVEDAAEAAHPVVMNSWVLNYLTADDRRAYVARLDDLGRRRDLSWVFAESPGVASGLPFPDHLAGTHATALQLVRWRGGERRVDHLGTAHPHGSWLHWAG